MVTISKVGDSTIKFEFTNNDHYLYNNGEISVPLNSLILVTDDTDLVVFKKIDGDVFVTFLIGNSNFSSKDELVAWYKENMVDGGGSDITSGDVQNMIDESISGKQDTLIAGENITISGNVISAEGDSITIDPSLDSGSTNPVANSAITTAINAKADKSTAGGALNISTTNNHEILNLLNQNGVYITGFYKEIGFGRINNRQIANQGTASFENFSLVETSAITTSVTSASTDAQVPSAKAVYDALQEGGGGNNVVELTQAEYDALVESGTVDPSAFYIITDAVAFDPSTKVDTSAFTAYSAATDAALSGKQDTLSAGTGIDITNNVISATGGGGGKAIEAGRGITVATGATADTVSFNLPISAGTGSNSIIEGVNTTANGDYSHAEGYYSNAQDEGSHAEGYSTAREPYCHSEGYATQAYAFRSHAEGAESVTYGDTSHAEGKDTRTYNHAEHASGAYNVSSSASTAFGDSGNTLFSVGNGTSDNTRHNAFEIRQNGDIYYFDGTNDVKLQDKFSSLDTTIGNINTILESI